MSKENKTTEKTLVPEIRFEGFSGEWKRRKLSEIAQLTMGQSPSGKNYTLNPNDHVLVQGNADMQDGEVSPRVWTTEVTKEAIPNDIIMSVRAPVGDVGTTSYPVVLGRGVAGIRANDFIFSFLEGLKANNYWDKFSTGSTFQSINSNHLNSLILATPTESEQEKIGSFMRAVGNKVKTKQKELTKLQNFKQAMLQKLFPKEGEKEPEMRFEGFEGEWEERKLGVIADINTGNKDLNESVERGSYPFFVRSDNIERIDSYSFDGEAILTAGDGRIGEVFHYINGKFDYHQRVYKISNFNKCDAKFVYYELQKNFRQHALSLNAKGTVSSLRRPMLTDYAMLLPSMEEQKLISKCFQVIDKNIQSKQAELKKLKQFKQAMLSKLFV